MKSINPRRIILAALLVALTALALSSIATLSSAEAPAKLKPINVKGFGAKGIVPTIIFHGTADKTVPFENAERFAKLMKEAGNACVLVPFEGKDHGFFNGSLFRKGNSDADLELTMKHSIEFLKTQSIVK